MAQDPVTTSELRARLRAEQKSLNQLRRAADREDPERHDAEEQYKALALRYARHRIERGAGPDPEALDPELFRDALYELAEPGRFAKEVEAARPSGLARETMTDMLSTGSPLDELMRALKAPADPWEVFDQLAPLRRHLRRWAEGTAADPVVAGCLDRIRGYADDFDAALADVDDRLDEIRAAYDAAHGGADRTGVRVGAGGRPEIVAADDWAAAAEHAPDLARDLLTALASAELAADRIRQTAAEMNRDLARFFAELVPRYFGLLSRLPADRRDQVTGGVKPTPALAGRLAAAANSTDFTADPENPLGFEAKHIPARVRPLTRLPGYKRVREAVFGRQAKDASTVVVRRQTPDSS